MMGGTEVPVKDSAPPQAPIGGIILAGGASRRMAGQHKALAELGKRPLIDHVIQRIRPQVGSLVLSVASAHPAWDRFGLRQVADMRSDESPDRHDSGDTPGPLTGLLSGMAALHDRHEWMLIVPCDAPFVPVDLGQQLLRKAHEVGVMACLAVYGGVWQPTFSLWHRDLLPALRHAVEADGLGGFKQFLRRVDFAEQGWEPAAIPPFFNINTAEDLATAQALLP